VSLRRGSRPLALVLAEGDIAAARASLIVVGRFNGLAPTGAEAAVDAALGGVISRRAAAGTLDGQFGAGQFLPASNAPLAADAVLVLSLGEPGKLDERRLPELGAAIVDALSTIGEGHAASAVHGAGVVGVGPGAAARLLVEGFARAVAHLPDTHAIDQLTLVESESPRVSAVRRALAAARVPEGVEAIIEPGILHLGRPAVAAGDDRATPEHLRVGLTRTSGELKVALISEEACDAADYGAYPEVRAIQLLDLLKRGVLSEEQRSARLKAMRQLGKRLYEEFFAWPRFDLPEQLRQARGRYLLLRLDESTVDLPWELLVMGRQFLARSHLLARQREIVAPGHAAAFVPPHARLRALVIGNPTQDLPGSRDEADSVARTLRRTGADVRTLLDGADQKQVLDLIDEFNPDLMHYAGHARFDPLNQADGGLVLSDGVLTAGTLGAQPRLPRLVFANGCSSAQTGAPLDQALEKAAATRDLAGGVLRAGARAFIGSQWPVDDRAATTFARAFYRALAAKGRAGRTPPPIGDAVHRARHTTILAHGLHDPAWAGYSLYGSPWASAL
jgi:CHAT domain/Cytosol aminopeptidase family, N-terminal domain